MAERASLKRTYSLVNRVAAFSTFFILASCGSGSEKSEVSSTKNINVPIVWQTSDLPESLSGFSISDEAPVQILIGIGGEVRLIDVDGAPVAQNGPYGAAAFGSGVEATIEDAQLRMFPAISASNDELTLYTYGAGLVAPIELELNPGLDDKIKGLCAAPANDGSALLQTAHWTALDPATLVLGEIRNEDGTISYQRGATIPYEKYITSCDIDGDYVATGGGFGLAIQKVGEEPTMINAPGVPTHVALQAEEESAFAIMTLSGGKVMASNLDGQMASINFAPGLSSHPLEEAGALAISSVGTVGGLPNGFVAIENQKGESTQIIYSDLGLIKDALSSDQ